MLAWYDVCFCSILMTEIIIVSSISAVIMLMVFFVIPSLDRHRVSQVR